MRKLKFQFKKLLVVALLATSFLDVALPVLAEEIITDAGQVLAKDANGNYGAYINGMTNGASIITNQTNANVRIINNGSTLSWQYLNTASGQWLNFNFSDAGQVALNNVVGTNMSAFAGKLTSDGAAGRIIISNPNGILFENGSYTNANALTLTTKGAFWDGNKFGEMILKDNASLKDVQIGQGNINNAAVMRIADDLNIVAPGIKIDGADILAGKNIRLITADGVTFLATTGQATGIAGTNKNAISYSATNNDNKTVKGSILVKDSALAVKDNTNGKVYFVTKGDSDKASIALINSAVDGKVNLDVAGNADFEVIGNLDIDGSKVDGNLIAKTLDKTLTLKNSFSHIIDSTKMTLGQYLESTYKTDLKDSSKVKDDLKKLFKTNTEQEIALMATQLGATYQSTATTLVTGTNTQVSGKGSVSIAGTTVIGDLIANGAGVSIVDTTAKSIDSTSTAGTAASYSRNDSASAYKTTTNYVWTPVYTDISTYKWELKPNAVPTVQSVQAEVGSEWKTVTFINGKWFDDCGKEVKDLGNDFSVTSSGQYLHNIGTKNNPNWRNIEWKKGPISGDYKWFYSNTLVIVLLDNAKIVLVNTPKPTTLPTVAGSTNGDYISVFDKTTNTLTSGSFIAGTISNPVAVETPTNYTNDTITTAYNPSNITAGTLNLSGITLKTGNSTTAANALTATATGDLVASGITAGNTKLTSTGGNITTQNDSKITGLLTAISNKNITLNKTSASSLIAGADEKAKTASTKISIENASKFGTVKAFAADIDIKGASEVNGGSVKASNNIKITNGSSVANSTIDAKNNIKVNNSTIKKSTLIAGNNVTVKNDSKLFKSKVRAGNDAIISNSSTNNINVKATNNISISGTDAKGKLTATAKTGDIKLTSVLGAANAKLNGEKVTVASSNLGNTRITAKKGVGIKDSTLKSTDIKAVKNVNIKNTNVGEKLVVSTQKGNIKLNKVTGNAKATLTADAGKIDVTNKTTLGNSNLTAGTTITVDDTTVNGNLVATAGKDIKLNKLTTNSARALKGDVTAKALGNIEVSDSTIKGGLTAVSKNTITLNKTSASSLIAGADKNAETASTKISIENASKFGRAKAFAADIDIKGASEINGGSIKSSKDINISNGSYVANSTIDAKNNVKINNSTIKKSTLVAGNNVTVKNDSKMTRSTVDAKNNVKVNNSTIKKSTLIAGNNVTVKNDSKLFNSKVRAGNDAIISNSSTNDINVKANNNISISGTDAKGKLTATAKTGDIELTSVLGAANAKLNGKKVTVASSTLGNTRITAKKGVGIKDSTLKSADIKAVNNVNIKNTSAGSKLFVSTQKGNINLDNVTGKAYATLTADAGKIDVTNKTTLGNSNLTAGTTITVDDTTVNGNLVATAGKDINITGSKVNKNLNIATKGNANLKGIYVGNDLTVSKANKVVISNSTDKAPKGSSTIESLANGAEPITDYNHDRFDDSVFDNIASGFGNGTISYVGGNLKISNSEDVRIVNTGIIGDLSLSNITNDADLITSYVGGTFSPDRATIGGDTSVYKSYIKNYTKFYPTDGSGSDVDRLKFGSQLDTAFRRQFTPRGFAASDDQIKAMKNSTISSIVKSKTGSMSFTKGFTTY